MEGCSDEPCGQRATKKTSKKPKGKALTPAEKMRRYREKLSLDPMRKEASLVKDRQRKKGQYKTVSQMSEKEHRLAKRRWRAAKKNERTKDTSKYSRQKKQSLLRAADENRALHSELKLLRSRLKREERLKALCKKRVQRLTPKPKEAVTPRSKTRQLLRHFTAKTSPKCPVKRTLQYHFALTTELQKLQKNQRKTLVQLKHGAILQKYGFLMKFRKDFCVSNPHHYEKKGTVCSVNRKLVYDFFVRNDVSRIQAGKKNTVTRKGVKKQKRLLNDTLHNLYLKFRAEHSQAGIKFVSFYKCKPFWVVRPKDSDRHTCMCKICSNMNFLAKAMYEIKAIDTTTVTVLLHHCACSVNDKSCMYSECKKCNLKSVPELEDRVVKDEYTWMAWEGVKEERKFKTGEMKKVKLVKKLQKHGSYDNLKSEFNNTMRMFKKHYYNTTKQYEHYATTKKNLQEDEVMIHVDFAENYEGKFAAEIQSVHFGASKQQISLHTGYFLAHAMSEVQSFCGVSDSLCHEPASIWAYLSPILKRIKDTMPHVKHIHFFSDGPTTQYKQKNNFYLLTTEIFKHGFESACWNFSAAGHGKGIPDGIGAALKRACDQLVKFGTDILNASMLVKEVTLTETSVMLYEITEKDIDPFRGVLSNLNLKAIPKTMDIHQLVTSSVEEVKYRATSCYCGGTSIQSDHAFQIYHFNASNKKHKNNTCTFTMEILFPEPKIVSVECDPSSCLAKLQECHSFSELKHECETQSMHLRELYGAKKCCMETGLACEIHYSSFIPRDFKNCFKKQYFPVRVRANGDCLPACGDVFATGKDENPDRLRLKIIHELVANEDYYLNEANLSKGYSHSTSHNELSKAFA